jgi:hypothetical protein
MSLVLLFNNFCTFTTVLVLLCHPALRIKRESGENPEQSRYCESDTTYGNTFATVPEKEWEGCR